MKWGIRWEFLIIIGIIICLLIATLGLSELGLLSGGKNDDDTVIYTGQNGDTSSYSVLESQLEEAGSKYYKAHYPGGVSKTTYVSFSKLRSDGYIKSLTDDNGRNCTGYVEITKGGSVFGYVKCSRYKTGGYDSSYE